MKCEVESAELRSIEGRVLESEKLIRKPPNELGIH